MAKPIGVILAGGRGRRMGGQKATVELAGKPLLRYPLEAMQQALDEVAILAKADSELPGLPGVTVWIEPERRQHPLVAIKQALALAGGRAVVVCACDLPFVTAELLTLLADADPGDATAVVAAAAGELQPLLGCYQPAAAAQLPRAPTGALRDTIAALRPRRFEVPDPEALFNVNTPYDLLQAAARLTRT